MNTITDDIKKLIEGNALAVSTINDDGTPHCVAVAFVKVISQNQALITNNYMDQTPKNIKRDSNIALAVWNKDWDGEDCTGYELKGTAEYFEEGKWIEEIKKIPENEGMSCKGAILVTITAIKKLS